MQHKRCGAKKVTEFNCKDEELTIYHEGHRHCIPKINLDEAITVAQNVQKNQPVSMELSKTPQQFQMDLLGYYVTMGQIEKVKEVAKHIPDKGLVEKLKYEDADKVLRELTGGRGLDAVDMFKNIDWLKNGMDELDLNYIFLDKLQGNN